MSKKESLTKFLNECFHWKSEYINNNDDYIDGYAYYLEETIDLGKAKVNLNCSNIDDDSLLDIIKNNYEIVRASHNYPDNALTFVNIDEIVDQVSGISNNDTNCIFTELTKDMTDNEIEESTAKCDFILSDDCIYFIPDFSSIQLVVDYDIIQKEIYSIDSN